MLYSARQVWERIVYRVLGHGRTTDILGFYIGPFAALAGILLLVSIVLYIKKKHSPAIVTGILSVLCALTWKFVWVDYYYRSSATWLPVIVVATVVGFIVFKQEKQSNRGEAEQTRLELERLRLEKERLELEQMRQQMAAMKQGGEATHAAQTTAEEKAAPVAEVKAPVDNIPVSSETPANKADSKLKEFFKKRCLYLLIAAVLGIVAGFGFQMIINGRIGTANNSTASAPMVTAQYGTDEFQQELEARSQAIGNGIGNALAGVALIPSMLITLVSTVFCWIGWLFKQRWAALVAGIGFSLALLFGLTCFYVPIVPMVFAIMAYVKLKKEAASK